MVPIEILLQTINELLTLFVNTETSTDIISAIFYMLKYS